MIHLLGAIGTLFLFIATHVFCYRGGRFKPNPSHLLLIAGLWLVPYVIFFSFFRPVISFWGSSLVLYSLLCLAYVMEYTLVELESPSMRIIQCVQNNTKGIAIKEELGNLFTDEEMIVARLTDLTDHGFVKFDGLRYSLTPQGTLIARLFAFYRNFIRRGMGG